MRFRGLILVAAMAVAGCSDSGTGGQGPGETPEGDILVRNNFFDPDDLEVTPGTAVVWAWASNDVVHNIVFDDGPASGDRGSGTYQRTFAAAGEYPYHCTIHGLSMNGVVSVLSAPAPGGPGNDDPPGGPGYPGGGTGGY
jgi:plastocyanin